MKAKRVSATNLFAKECIVSALIQLIYTKPLSSITISELCQKAGVSRMTFYRNYNSIDEIFLARLSELFDEYKNDARFKNKTGIFYDKEHMIHYFTALFHYRDFMNGLLYCGFGIHFLEMMNDYLLKEWQHSADPLTLAAFSGSLYNVFSLWATNGYTQDPAILAQKLSLLYTGSGQSSAAY